MYSPRTTLSRLNEEISQLTTNLAINVDKYILGFFIDSFEAKGGELTLVEFVAVAKKNLKSWQRELKDR